MTPQPVPRQPAPRSPPPRTSPRVPFVEPVALVRALPPSPPCSPSELGGHAIAVEVNNTAEQQQQGRGFVADLDEDGVDDAMGLGAGESGGARRPGLKRTALSESTETHHHHHQHHHRHHSDPDPATATTIAKLDVRDAADSILHQQVHEREKRLRQQQHSDALRVKVVQQAVQEKASRSAPQRGRSVTLTASHSHARPQRWSIGEPSELLAGLAVRAPWDAVPCTSPPSEASAANGIPTVSLQIKQGHGHGHPPERCTTDIAHERCGDEPIFTDHLVRFVYPERGCHVRVRDEGVQASGPPPLQLRVLPQHRCACSPCGRGARGAGVGPCVWVVQALFSLAGLACVILVLALVGAAAFHATEGPHEDLQVRQLNREQTELVVQLATDLRVVLPDDATWRAAIERSVESHEQMVLRAAAAGYGEGGAGEGGARIWTYPGGLLFAASLLTTLGFGAPVPRTPLGRLTAVVLAVLGIPLNVVLALQLGRQLCVRLPRLLPLLSASRPPAVHPSPPSKGRTPCSTCWSAPAMPVDPGGARCEDGAGLGFRWAPLLLPVGSLLVYYVLGMALFGAVLALPASEWVVFPLSLTAAGGVARVPGWVRVCYAAYLEGGVLLAAVAVALLQAPATTATTDFAMGLGILDLDEYYSA
ncbi:uncharacterized protein LOC113209844 [Frankliniella occidentalis]|uniref:Uncharacterized protein LOC113209844 n=1 Tax=Frankliniella occidentalis TaxID=133901 RepID=A0A6J1SRA4_FRAOC|nr:uncharacterized protein LOC113209844 [Frankliniella occidentalis]XP_026283346.2 uncharacterized protein LOC113209844 [Frankliniella occidentalis]XP_026283347.2 uncharacterized protein LOC113209844 [Frankliniella occidentalis]XP_026283348.2 uncharacterized protein LOC113209844 [Frankliniella occidentalis]XP_052120237.1 uncharacterized protein LOC113209844 [Frankliniella occidentalis]XP_052120238.1 uncharacterized protein LOC113209844 [Frankliniella occidentalis]XP_052120239.1 uncharacterize